MKLTQIAIDGTGAGRAINLDQLSQNLNIVYCTNGAGRARLRSFIRYTLFGTENWNDEYFGTMQVPNELGSGSFIQVSHGVDRYRINRNNNIGIADQVSIDRVSIDPVSIAPVSPVASSITASQLVQGIDATTYDTFFNVSISETHSLIQRLIQQIQTRFGTQLGRSTWDHPVPFATWQRDAETRSAQLNSLKLRQEQLGQEKNRLTIEMERHESEYSARAASLAQQVDLLQGTLGEKQAILDSNRTQLRSLDDQIAELRMRIEHLRSQIHHVSRETQGHDALPLRYQRLDEIDNQVRRWRVVQTDVHEERVRLRDEIATCDRLDIECEDHPYHVSRQLVVGLGNKVDATETIARKLESIARSAQADPGENWHNIVELCGLMRDDLYALCSELGRQYKHVRHKAAVAEMKQLRRCYHEMDENIKRLVRRRELLLEEIRQLDPAGAELIALAETQFCQCAEHEGYLEARRRYAGNVQTELQYSVSPDWSNEKRQLDELESQRASLSLVISGFESEVASGEADLHRLIELKSSSALGSLENLRSQLKLASDQWLTVDQQIRDLMIKIDEDRRLADYVPDTFAVRADKYVSQLTGGRLTKLAIDHSQRLTVTSDQGTARQFHEIDRGHQDLVCLALIAAANRDYAHKGVWIPLLIDNLFVNLDANERHNAVSLLTDLSRKGHQIIAVSGDREMLNQSAAYDHNMHQLDVRNFDLAYNDLPDTYISHPAIEPTVLPRTEPPFPTASSVSVSSPPLPVRSVINTTSANQPYPSIGVATRLSEIDLVESIYVSPLSSCGINTLGQLLDLDPENISIELSSRGFLASQLDRWQAQAWMLVCLPELRSHDARILVACGITEPEQLDSMPGYEILDRIKQHLGSVDGRRAGVNLASFDILFIENLKRSLQNGRSRWQTDEGFGRFRQRRSWNRTRQSSDQKTYAQQSHPTRNRDQHYDRRDRNNDRRDRNDDPRDRNSRSTSQYSPTTNGSAETGTANDSNFSVKFYLEMGSEISAAPSIGTRTAERFHKIGVNTIAEFLNGDATKMEADLDYKRITVDTILSWQNQTRLMVQVPNMRVHDVQLLVACGLTEPTDIAEMEPKKLFGIIRPFSETKDGERILRSGKKPDLDEITEWIESATHKRSLQAA